MSSLRNETRIAVVQVLYYADISNSLDSLDFLFEKYNYIKNELHDVDIDDSYAKKVIEGIVSKRNEIDELMNKVATEWPVEKMDILDRNILRLGVFEVLFNKTLETPPKVAVNEAIEVSKKLSGIKSSKFINGILGTILSNIDIKKQEEVGRKVKKYVSVFVYKVLDEKPLFLLIRDIWNKWTIPKGEILPSDTIYPSAFKIMKEKFEIEVKPEEEFGENTFIAHPPEGVVRKEVLYVLAKTEDKEVGKYDEEKYKDVSWFSLEEMKELKLYKDLKKIAIDTAENITKSYQDKKKVK